MSVLSYTWDLSPPRKLHVEMAFLLIKSLCCGASGGHRSCKFPSTALPGDQGAEGQLHIATGCVDIRFSGRSWTICLIRPVAHLCIFFNPSFTQPQKQAPFYAIIQVLFSRKLMVLKSETLQLRIAGVISAQDDFRVPVSVINHWNCTFWVYDFDKIPSFELWPCIQH